MSRQQPPVDQSGGVNIQGGTVSTGGGDIVGRDKISQDSSREFETAFEPVAKLFSNLDPVQRSQALQELERLKQEAAKGEKRDDGVMAKITERLVKLVPNAAGAIVSAFGSPILGAITGPVTKY